MKFCGFVETIVERQNFKSVFDFRSNNNNPIILNMQTTPIIIFSTNTLIECNFDCHCCVFSIEADFIILSLSVLFCISVHLHESMMMIDKANNTHSSCNNNLHTILADATLNMHKWSYILKKVLPCGSLLNCFVYALSQYVQMIMNFVRWSWNSRFIHVILYEKKTIENVIEPWPENIW